jgi:hypothetical protein
MQDLLYHVPHEVEELVDGGVFHLLLVLGPPQKAGEVRAIEEPLQSDSIFVLCSAHASCWLLDVAEVTHQLPQHLPFSLPGLLGAVRFCQ